MKLYEYTCIDTSDAFTEGHMWAENQQEVAIKLKEQEYTIISIHGATAKSQETRWRRKDVIEFSYRLSLLLKAGIPLRRIIVLLCEQHPDNINYIRLSESIQRGKSLASALYEQGFPSVGIAVLKAGEASGSLDDSLLLIRNYYEQEKIYKEKIIGALTYPSFLLCLMIIFIGVAIVFILPSFQRVFQTMHMDVPAMTQVIFTAGNMIREHIVRIILLHCLGLIILGIWYYKGGGKLYVHKWLWKQSNRYNWLACIYYINILQVWSLLIQNGISLIETLELSTKLWRNQYARICHQDMINAVKHGKPLGLAMKDCYIGTPFIHELIQIGEETGETVDMLCHCSTYYQALLEQYTKKMERLLEPIMLSCMGISVGFLVITILLPMFDAITSMMK